MDDLTFTFIYVLSTFFHMFVIYNFMKIFFTERRASKRITTLCYLLNPILVCSCYLLFSIPIVNTIVNVVSIFIITLCYNSELKKKAAATLIIYALEVLTELLIIGIVGYTITSYFIKTDNFNAWGLVAVYLFDFFESILLKNMKNVKKDSSVPAILWLTIFFVPISSIYLIVSVFINASQFVIVSSTIIIFAINILVFYLYDVFSLVYEAKIDNMVLKQEKDYYYNQCELMTASTSELKAFRHDFKNHLATLGSIFDDYNIDEGKEYVNDLLGEINYDNVYSMTGNTGFDSIINYKLRNAKNQKINTSISIKIPTDLNINITDVVVILGNLLDNALNALEKVEEKHLKLDIMYDKKQLFIHIENSFNGKVKYGNSKIMTLKRNKENHGFGLTNIEKAIDNYNGIFDITHDKNIFAVDVMLYVK